MNDKRPHVADRSGGGQGVQAQRKVLPASDQIPFVRDKDSTGRGVSVQRKELANGTGRVSAPFP